jgi:hypothetical protein
MGGSRRSNVAARRWLVVSLVFVVLAIVGVADVTRAPKADAYPGAPWFAPGWPYNGNFPDPTVVRDGNTYYAYGTNTGGAFLPVMSSTDLNTWTPRPAYNPGVCNPANDAYFNDALPCAPSWALRFATSHPRMNSEILAPGVIKVGSTWLAYLTVRVTAEGGYCIGLATSNSPIGPFVNQGSGPLWCDLDKGGSRDAEPFRNVDGKLYLHWKSEGIPGNQPTKLWARELSSDGRSFAPGSAPTELLRTAQAWEGNVIENPSMVAWNGAWWLFYSGNEWRSGAYAMGYARCASALGPCTRVENGPVLRNFGYHLGPGGGSAFVDGWGRLMLAYHWWNAPYTDYPSNPNCDGNGMCTSQGQRWLGITGFQNRGPNQLTLDPMGSFDTAANVNGVLTGSGWAIDGEARSGVPVHVYVDDQFRGQVTTGLPRPDVGALFPGVGNDVGFSFSVPGLADGTHRVCLFAINVGAGYTNPSLGCRNIGIEPQPPPLPTGPAPPIAPDTRFNPMTPTRVLDTRDGTGFAGGPLRDGWTIPLDVTGPGGVPGNASSVLLNLTSDRTVGGSGFVTAYPCGEARPLASSLNIDTGTTAPNLVSVRVGAEGKVCLYSSRRTDLIADVVGWYRPDATGSPLQAVTPSRVLDTREDSAGRLGQGETLSLDVTGVGDVPSGASAVVLNTTITEPTASSFLTVYPGDTVKPLASNLNWSAGDTRANLVTVPVGPNGTVNFYNNRGGVHVLADVVGWYGPPGDAGDRFTASSPSRVVDTRQPLGLSGRFQAGQTRQFTVAGAGGVPSTGVSAVVVNATVTNTTGTSFLTIFPTGEEVPTASNLNWFPGQTRPNLVVVPLDANGSISLYNDRGQTDVVLDVVGWFS